MVVREKQPPVFRKKIGSVEKLDIFLCRTCKAKDTVEMSLMVEVRTFLVIEIEQQ